MSPVIPLMAALDLGSNNFRLLIAQMHHNKIVPLYEAKETLRIGAAVDEQGNILPEIFSEMVDCLRGFKEIIQSYQVEVSAVAIVATHVFRHAPNSSVILPKLERILGYPIRVLSGEEEAWLVFKGVTHSLPPSDEKRFVVDIGGGSTECIVGRGYIPEYSCSMKMGCVSWTKRFFDVSDLSSQSFEMAEQAALEQLQHVQEALLKQSWDVVYASAGTLRIVMEVLSGLGFSQKRLLISELCELKEKLIEHRCLSFVCGEKHSLNQLSVLPGGVALLMALMKAFNVEEIFPSEGALQLGVLYDLCSTPKWYELHEQKRFFSTMISL
jgi:exopolyphosphatase / guanosine-5'-triphosphate,3'-diphosphate pyrophosphatase